MKKIVFLLLTTLLLLNLLTACNSNPDPDLTSTLSPHQVVTESSDQDEAESLETEHKIIVGFTSMGAESEWRTTNVLSVMDACREVGFELIHDDAQGIQENQLKALRKYIRMDVDAIVIIPATETGWDTVFKEVNEAGIPIIVVDRAVDVLEDQYATTIKTNFVKQGEKAAKWLIDYMDQIGRGEEDINIVELLGAIGAYAQIGREEGFHSAIAERPNFRIIQSETGEFTISKGQEVMEAFLEAHDQIDVVVAQNDNMAIGAVEAIKAAGKVPGKDIIIISFDAVKMALESIFAGDINATVECSPIMGPLVVKCIMELQNGETLPKLIYTTDEKIFTRENAEQALPNRKY